MCVPLEYVVLTAGIAALAVITVERWRRRRIWRNAAALRRFAESLSAIDPENLPEEWTETDQTLMSALVDVSRKIQKGWDCTELEPVLSRISDGVILLDSAGVVRYVNRSQAERFKLPERDITGSRLQEVWDDQEVSAVASRCLESGIEDVILIEPEMGKQSLQVHVAPMMNRQGCVIVLHDRSELRRLERIRREFVANISHELRTPLATLKLLSETLELEGGSDPVLLQDYLRRIDIEVDQLAQMVDELGELSLIETGQVALFRGPVDVAVLLRRTVGRLESHAARAGLTLDIHAPGTPVEAFGDERRLEQVLVNLLHNAIKFTPPGGTVAVFCKPDEKSVTVTVKDDGIGIPPDQLDRVFERFYKVDRSRSGQGTGLGLAIARHIIGLHGGAIWVESVEGGGAAFSFTLPLMAYDGETCGLAR